MPQGGGGETSAAVSIASGVLIVSIGGLFIGGPGVVTRFAVMLVPASMALLAANCATHFDQNRQQGRKR